MKNVRVLKLWRKITAKQTNKQMRDEPYVETLSIYTLDLEIFITLSCCCDNMRRWQPP